MGRILHSGWVRVAAFAAVAVLVVSSACGSSLFVCSSSDECAGAGADGVCEAEGWCSFPDVGCPSGRRFGDLAGDGLAGACVPDADATTGPDATTQSDTVTSTVSSATSDPTIATLEGGIETSTEESSGSETEDEPGVCGDGTIDRGEGCDQGTDNGNGGICRADCQANVCGDGYVGPGEACDGTPDCSKQCLISECGNGRIEGTEECDDRANFPLECGSIGYVSGTYTCAECMIDASNCVGCGPDGCTYEPCMAGQGACDDGEMCVNLDNSFCTAECNSDEDCLGEIPQACVDVKGQYCLPLCVNGECPMGLTCFEQIMPPVCL